MSEARKGTTTVGLVCKDGVIIAADKKASAMYVENRYERKVYQINDRVAITTAGMVGDLQYLTRVLKAEASLQEIRSGRMSTRSAATLLSNILHGNRYYPFMVMLLVGGYDEEGPSLYSVDPVGGVTNGEKIFTTGSGGPIALGVLESQFKSDMGVEEGLKLAIRALKAAKERDLYTGGVGFNVVVIKRDGLEDLSEDKIEKLVAN